MEGCGKVLAMSSVMYVPWENHLAKLVHQPGGLHLGDALEKAGDGLSSIADKCLAAVDSHLDELHALCATGGPHPSDQLKLQIYHHANDIYTVAGTFGLTYLGEVAFCLCELVDRLRALNRWNLEAVQDHLSAAHLPRYPAAEGGNPAIIAELRRLIYHTSAMAE